jgi:hypothetical protein
MKIAYDSLITQKGMACIMNDPYNSAPYEYGVYRPDKFNKVRPAPVIQQQPKSNEKTCRCKVNMKGKYIEGVFTCIRCLKPIY